MKLVKTFCQILAELSHFICVNNLPKLCQLHKKNQNTFKTLSYRINDKIESFVNKKAILLKDKKPAFSLIEIMVALIVVSLFVTALAPIITKKVSSTATTLSSAMGLGVDSRIFLYSESKNKIDGCKLSEDKTYLECPFKVPEGVTSINLAISGAGGGGASAFANVESKSSAVSFTINDKVKNIKIPYLVSAGGNGGVGNTYTSTNTTVIRPKSQTDCDKVAVGSYYKSGLCITKNLTLADIQANTTIKALKSNTTYSADQGKKVCWTTGNTGYTTWYESCTNPDGCGTEYYHAKTAKHFPVCSHDAAVEMCNLYNLGDKTFGKWRLPTSKNEVNISWEAYNMGRGSNTNGAIDAPASQKCYYGPTATYRATSVGYDTFTYSYKCTSTWGFEWTDNDKFTENYNYYFNPCMPDYVWYSSVSSTSFSADGYDRYTYAKCDGSYWNVGGRNAYIYTESDKSMAALSVICVLDWLGENTSQITTTYVGGGGASGALISDVEIPNNLLADWQGATVTIEKGVKGSSSGSSGGTSSVKIVKGGVVKFGLSVGGGSGGTNAYSAHGYAGSPYKQYTYIINGTSTISSTISYQQTVSLSNGVTFTFTPGNSGQGGAYNGLGGISPAPASLGAGGGGQGGSASGSYSKGQDGYVVVNYQNVYKGAAGGGGSGSAFARVENIPVQQGKIITLKIGRGGLGGGINTAGGNGGTTSFSYNGKTITLDGGKGGKVGTGASPSNPSYTPVHGKGGDQVSYSITSDYKSLTILEKKGLAGAQGKNVTSGSSTIAASGGLGGSSGINEWSISASIPVSELSFGCGGMLTYADYACYNGEVNGSFSQSDFSNPGKVYKTNNTEYGSSGAGGGGGGINYNTGEIGKGSAGQNAYILLWWDSKD